MGRPYKPDTESTRRGKTLRIPLALHAEIAAAAKAEKLSIPAWVIGVCRDALTAAKHAAAIARGR